MPLPSFTVTPANIFDILGNIVSSEIVGNGLGSGVPGGATVQFVPNVPINAPVTWAGNIYRINPVIAAVNTDGEIRRNGDPVQLLANDGGLSVENLQWTVHIGGLRPFTFDAPGDGATIDLSTVTPVPNVPVTGIPNIPDDVALVGGDVQFYAQGNPLGSPLGLDIVASVGVPTAVKTTSYTAAVGDLIPADATSGGFTVALPTSPSNFAAVVVKKIDATTNTVTVQRGGSSDVFNTSGGPSNLQLTMPGESVWLQYKASGGIWYVVWHGMPTASLDARYVRPDSVDELDNKTLITPQIDFLYNTSGTPCLFLAGSTTDNYMNLSHGSGFLELKAEGSDPNVDVYYSHKGTGAHRFYAYAGTSITVAVDGAAPNIDGLLVVKGTGKWRGPIVPRVGSTTSSATPTINTDNVDQYGLTAQAVNITSMTTNLSGTPADGQKLLVYIVGTGARSISWGSKFENGPVALPSTTISTQRLDTLFIWNAATSKWRCMASGSA